jgi:hypothetical protein
MWGCSPSNVNQWWVWDPVTKQLQSNQGKCLSTSSLTAAGTALDLVDCDANAATQQWMLDGLKSTTEAVPTASYTICSVVEQVGEETVRLAANDGSATCNSNENSVTNPWHRAENPRIQFADPDSASVMEFGPNQLTLKPAFSPNPDVAGRYPLVSC